MDRYLDTTRLGPSFLRRPEAAGLVVATLQRGLDKGLYDLRAFVVMSNHVHILFRPQQRASRLLQWLKGTTARDANQMLTRTGKPFWQRESYDYWVRDGQGLERVATYLESNPVKAGITAVQRLGNGELKFRRCALKRTPQTRRYYIVAHASACCCRLQPAVKLRDRRRREFDLDLMLGS